MENMDRLNNLRKSFESLRWYEWLMMAVMMAVAVEQTAEAFIVPEASHNPAWLSVLNLVFSICGVVCIFFTAKASVSACAFGILNTIVYSVYLAYWHVYGTLCLELFVYLPISVGQWILWSRHRDRERRELVMVRSTEHIISIVCLMGLGTMVGWKILDAAGGNVPLFDAMTVSIGVVAMVLSMLRYHEQYILWFAVDLVTVAMFLDLQDPVYLVKRSIYLVMAVVGLRNWYMLSKRNVENE